MIDQQRFRITVRGDDEAELRGHVIGLGNVQALASSVEPFGWMVLASIAEVQSPSPLPQDGDRPL